MFRQRWPWQTSGRVPRTRQSSHARRLRMEALEPRCLLAVFTVESALDSTVGPFHPRILRGAILAAEANPGPDTIVFDMQPENSGPYTIRLVDELPTITESLVIDGFSQSGSVRNSNPAPEPIGAAYMIEIEPGEIDPGRPALSIDIVADQEVRVQGLLLRQADINVRGAEDNVYIEGNRFEESRSGSRITIGPLANGVTIGGITPESRNDFFTTDRAITLESDGNRVFGNQIIGNPAIVLPDLLFSDVTNNRIGGTATGQENVISGQVRLAGSSTTDNYIQGNNTQADSGLSVLITDGAHHNHVVDNVISGNSLGIGVEISDGAHDNRVSRNLIGTTADGMTAKENSFGVRIDNAPANIIGGDNRNSDFERTEGNLISGNTQFGVFIFGDQARDNRIQGNYIGTDITGNDSLPNGFFNHVGIASGGGVAIQDAPSNYIGPAPGDSAGAANLISGNIGPGISLFGGGIDPGVSQNNQILHNRIGTDRTGMFAIGNERSGIMIINSPANVIGSATTAGFGLISGNSGPGIHITGSEFDGSLATENRIVRTMIGTNAAGDAGLGNTGDGILIENEAWGNIIGSPDRATDGNVIAGNGGHGISIFSDTFDNNPSHSNEIHHNLIGVAGSDGALGLSNRESGISILSSANNRVTNNTISWNTGWGVEIRQSASPASGNELMDNRIGTNLAGDLPRGNGSGGVRIYGASNNRVGAPVEASNGWSNLISANNGPGVHIPYGNNNTVQGNFIGTDTTGRNKLGNAGHGVFIESGENNLVGGIQGNIPASNDEFNEFGSLYEGNLISGNEGDGVNISFFAIGNKVQGNYVGTNVDGDAALPNGCNACPGTDGIRIYGASENHIGARPGEENASARGNLISGNWSNGVTIADTSFKAATLNTVDSNFIGTDRRGTATIPNQGIGVHIVDGDSNKVGVAGGNIISGNGAQGVLIEHVTDDPDNNIVDGNYIGVDRTGTLALPNVFSGVAIVDGDFNDIGDQHGNLISGNGGAGVLIANANNSAILNTVDSNYVGTDRFGMSAIPNVASGVVIQDADQNTIGRNLISGNQESGVLLVGLQDDAEDNFVDNNLIGTDQSGARPIPNGLEGVTIQDGTRNQVRSNRIAFNTFEGVLVESGTENTISRNGIHSNTNLGIDLRPLGVTPNDQLDGDPGANDLQNAPVLISADIINGMATVRGSLNSAANTDFEVEFFANSACDASGHGEGELFVGSVTGTTDGDGNWNPQRTFAPGVVGPDVVMTATATKRDGGILKSTSEFSNCVAVINLDDPGLDYGDAPAGYPTTLADDGARHWTVGPFLGGPPDEEMVGTHSAAAGHDDANALDDEDGVTMGQLVRGTTTNIQVVASAMAVLDYFFDFDQDGVFGNNANEVLTTNLVPGTQDIPVTVPLNAALGTTFARFRISSAGGLGPAGPAADGEVEDHVVTIGNAIVSRHVSYSAGLATDKAPLLPGETAAFANYISHPDGITSVSIDVGGLTGEPMLSDFTFRLGNDDNPSNWPMATAPAFNFAEGQGAGGSDRIELTWPAGSLVGQWLQVVMVENAAIHLPSDAFYVGSAPGESGDATSHALVNGFDFVGPRDNPTINAPIDSDYDYNRDGLVDGADMAIARDNVTNFTTALRLITPSAPPPPLAALVLDRGEDNTRVEKSHPTQSALPLAADAAVLEWLDLRATKLERPYQAQRQMIEVVLEDLSFELQPEITAAD